MKQVINIRIERELDKDEEALFHSLTKEELESEHERMKNETLEWIIKQECSASDLKEFEVSFK